MARVLIIDDDPDVLGVLDRMLKSGGHDTVCSQDGAEALDLIQKDGLDVIVTDLILPEREGIDIIRDIRNLGPPVPVIAISGGGGGNAEEYLKWARMLGAAKTLAKPFTADTLLDAISDVVTDTDENGTADGERAAQA